MTAGTRAVAKLMSFRSLRMAAMGVLTGVAFMHVFVAGPPSIPPAISSFQIHPSPGRDRMHAAQGVMLRETSTESRFPHRGGWAVAERCRHPLDVLVFVHATAREWRRRATLRDTLLEEVAARQFSMAGVFFVRRRAGDLELDAWLNLEVDMTGDLVVFPSKDGLFNATPKWLGAMRWVADHCPTVKWILKINDDVMVEPFKIQRYFRAMVRLEPRSLHCFVIKNQRVFRSPWSSHYAPRKDFPKDTYFRHCSGRSVMMTNDVMRELLRAASVVPCHPPGDAYVTGDLALVQGIGHVNLQPLYECEPSATECINESRCFVTLGDSEYDLTTGRRSQWGLLLWNEGLKRKERVDLSPRLATADYSDMFNETRLAFRHRPWWKFWI